MPPTKTDTALEGEYEDAAGRAIVAAANVNDVDATLAISLTRAEVDTQIATAKKYPRPTEACINRIVELATWDTETATECIYSLPRDGKAIVGPSVRLAELIAQQWGNNRYYSRVTAVDRREGYVEAEGVYQDLETNSVVGAKVRRRITNSKGRVFNDDMITVTGNAAASIALRNAILKGVPRPIWRRAYVAAAAAVRGDVKTLGARRVALLEAFGELGIKAAQVFALGRVKGEADIGLDELVVMSAIYTSIKNGEVTADELIGRQMPPQTDKTLAQAFRDSPAADAPQADAGGPSAADVAKDAGEGFQAHTLPKKTAAPVIDDTTGEIFDDPTPDADDSAAGETLKSPVISDALPAQVEQPAAAEPAAADPDPDAPFIEAFGDFTADARKSADWAEVKAKLSAFRKTDAFKSASADLRKEAMVNAYRATCGISGETVTPDTDPSFFSLWLLQAPQHEVKAMFGRLIQSKAYDGLPDLQKDAISASVSNALGEDD